MPQNFTEEYILYITTTN